MSEPFLIRDVYNSDVVKKIASNIKQEYASFDQKGFLHSILPKLDEQSYSERKVSITNALISYLPDNYKESVAILLKITPSAYEGEVISGTIDRFYVSTFTSYISQKGFDDYETSVDALYEMTKSFTAEWDIRTFLLKYPEKTLQLLKEWAKDSNAHVRRLVSEGSRPNLPWGKKLKFVDENPETTTLPILEILQDDPSEYVRRSVANHLNDLSKNNGDLVVKHLEQWQKKKLTKDKERLINHALRTLIKQGHTRALSLIGYSDDIDIDIETTSFTNEVKWNDKFEFEFSLKNNKSSTQKLLIDFIIGFQKKDGTISNKVFKLKKAEMTTNEVLSFRKGHSFRPITTRVYYPGKHMLYIQINGKIVSQESFMLLKS